MGGELKTPAKAHTKASVFPGGGLREKGARRHRQPHVPRVCTQRWRTLCPCRVVRTSTCLAVEPPSLLSVWVGARRLCHTTKEGALQLLAGLTRKIPKVKAQRRRKEGARVDDQRRGSHRRRSTVRVGVAGGGGARGGCCCCCYLLTGSSAIATGGALPAARASVVCAPLHSLGEVQLFVSSSFC